MAHAPKSCLRTAIATSHRLISCSESFQHPIFHLFQRSNAARCGLQRPGAHLVCSDFGRVCRSDCRDARVREQHRPAVVSNDTALRRSGRYSGCMTHDRKTMQTLSAPLTGYGYQVRGSRKGLGGDPPNGRSRGVAGLTVRTVEMQAPGGAILPTCPLCHTSTVAVTVRALCDGACWRCARCGQMWDAIRLQTAADYTRHAQKVVTP